MPKTASAIQKIVSGDEQNRRGDAGVHVVIAHVEKERRGGKEQTHGHERQHLTAAQAEILPPQTDHHRQNRQCEGVAVEQHRVGRHSRMIERQGEERVHPVGRGRHRTADETFGSDIHGRIDFGRPFGSGLFRQAKIRNMRREKIGLRKKVAKRRFAPRVQTAKKRPQRKTSRYFDFIRARIRLKLTGVIPR